VAGGTYSSRQSTQALFELSCCNSLEFNVAPRMLPGRVFALLATFAQSLRLIAHAFGRRASHHGASARMVLPRFRRSVLKEAQHKFHFGVNRCTVAVPACGTTENTDRKSRSRVGCESGRRGQLPEVSTRRLNLRDWLVRFDGLDAIALGPAVGFKVHLVTGRVAEQRLSHR